MQLNDTNNIDHEVLQQFISLIPPGEIVLELGSGLSTHKLSEYFQVHTVEHNEKYLNKCSNAIYYHVELDYQNKYNAEQLLQAMKAIAPYAIIIDGPPDPVNEQTRSSALLLDCHLKKAKVVLIDDTHRDYEKEMSINIACEYLYTITEFTNGIKKAVILQK